MDKLYKILLVEKDEHTALEIERFLKATSGKEKFIVSRIATLPESTANAAFTTPDIVLLDAFYVSEDALFLNFKNYIADNHIPVLLLSNTNGQELKDKAAIVGAEDYLQKNKLNLYYLRKFISSALQLNEKDKEIKRKEGNPTSIHKTFSYLLDQVSDAVIICTTSGNIHYANAVASRILTDKSWSGLLRKFIPKEGVAVEYFEAEVPVKNSKYAIRISAINWEGSPAVCISIRQAGVSFAALQEERISILKDFVHSCHTPFLLLRNNQIEAVNNSFLALANKTERAVINQPLEDVILLNSADKKDLFHPAEVGMSARIKGIPTELNHWIEYHQVDITSGDEVFSVCSLTDLGGHDDESKGMFSIDRMMEIASHDMREPVRTSVNYMQMIHSALKKDKNEKLLSYSETAIAEMERVDSLLSDIKTYISFNHKPVSFTKVRMKLVVENALQKLKKKIDAADAMINVSSMPEIQAEESDMEQLLYNLLDNAIKFRQADKRSYIEVIAAKVGDDWHFCVKDNGIGIAPKFHDVIFSPFKKLNRNDEYPGSGMGLSICKKIVEAHGGQLWVETKEGFGSSFFFSLPDRN